LDQKSIVLDKKLSFSIKMDKQIGISR